MANSLLSRVGAAANVFARGVVASARFAGRAMAATSGPGTAYAGAAKQGGALKFWRPNLASPDREWLGERTTVVARARDAARNDTAIASATRRRVNSAVGNGWQLSARVDGEALGFDDATTAALNRAIERAWRAYAYGHTFEMDAQRQQTFGGLMRTAARGLFVDGEICANLEWVEFDASSTWSTRLNLIDPDRLSNPGNVGDTDRIRGGVERDLNTGAAIGYHVRSRHPADVGIDTPATSWRRIDRWTPWGRPQFLHVFDRERPGQSRGVTQLAAALRTVRSLERFGQATLENAILNALMLGAVKSNSGPGAVSESFAFEDLTKFEDQRSTVYDGRTVNLGENVQLPVLPLGDELQIFTASRDVNSFEAFSRTLLRRIAASVGCTYEELAMDYSTTNYSSARAAMIHAWQETLAMQTLLRDLLVQPLYVAWLEEAIETGRIALPAGAPDYWENLDAYTRTRWIAPGKGYIDATKEIQADAMEIENGFNTQTEICASQGRDIRDVMHERKAELEEWKRLGLKPPALGVTLAAAAAAPVAAAAPDTRPEPAQTEAA